MLQTRFLPYALPASEGVNPEAIRRMVETWEERGLGIHSMMLIRNDRIIAEAWWAPYRPELPHMMNSLSKSWTSTAIGFAVQDGLLTVEDPVLSFFPHMAEQPHDNMKKMRVKHLLTMSTGHSPQNADFIFSYPDPVRAFLESEVCQEPGSRFLYNTGATYMLSAIIRRVTGCSTFDYLQDKLFAPLGIKEISWETCPLGNSYGGVGLNIKTEDIAKLGQLYLHEGKWNGKQLLSPEWVREATRLHIRNDNATETPWLDSDSEVPENVEATDWNRGYGYQFWRCIPKNVYRADGAFGQYCIVMPDQHAVLAITAGSSNMQAILHPIWEILIPAMQDRPLPDAPGAQAALTEMLRTRAIERPQATEPVCTWNHTYQLPVNPFGVSHISFRFQPEGRSALIATKDGRDFVIYPGTDAWYEQYFSVNSEPSFPFNPYTPYAHLAFAGAWRTPNRYELRVVCTHSAYIRTFSFTFMQDRLQIEYHQNVACPPEGIRWTAYRV